MERKLEQYTPKRIRLGRTGKEWRIIGIQWRRRRRLGIQIGECARFSKQERP
jgi:hypothetical protein